MTKISEGQNRRERIEKLLQEAFAPFYLLVEDESSNHRGREGQESHFRVILISKSFEGMDRLQRQREVIALIREEFQGGLHALSLQTFTPEEAEKRGYLFHQSPPCQNKVRLQKDG